MSCILSKYRSSLWYITFVVAFSIATDIFSYAVIIPFIPFRLEALGFKDPSSHSGWLLFAYSAGLVLSTIPIAHLSEIYKSRRIPFLFGTLTLIGSQILFMLAPFYSLLIIARVFQGISSSIVWTVGLALICDVAPRDRVGQQLGIALTGLSIGFILAPPIGGILYQKHGFRAPIIVSICLGAADLLGRVLVIEPNADHLQRKPDLAEVAETSVSNEITEQNSSSDNTTDIIQSEKTLVGNCESTLAPIVQGAGGTSNSPCHNDDDSKNGITFNRMEMSSPVHGTPPRVAPKLTLPQVLLAILRSKRTCVAFLIALFIGIHLSGQEPTFPLRLSGVYGFNSGQIGLVYIAGSIPNIFSAPLAGWLSDRKRPDLIILIFSSSALPWIILMAVRGPLALFIVSNVIAVFFSSGILTPASAELAAVTRAIPEIGLSYQYGIFNIAYGIGSGIGPIIGSQLFDHAKHGWTDLISLSSGLMMTIVIITFLFAGEIPYAKSLVFSKFQKNTS